MEVQGGWRQWMEVGSHLASDGLVTGGADTGGGGRDAQLLQVLGEAAQHVVQRGLGLGLLWSPGSLNPCCKLLGRRMVRAA